MRRWRVVVLLVLVAIGMTPALPASAGGWAVTLLDPLPDKVQADRTYTIGYWVLQHGSHPFEGELGRTGLRLVGKDKVLQFEGRALPEAAHYAVAVAVPAGRWQVYAMQGWFAEFEVGTLTVPGGLVLTPSDMDVNVGAHSDGGSPPRWGAVHPPSSVADGHDGKVRPASEPVRPPQQSAAAEPRSPRTTALLVVGGMVVLLGSGLAAGPLRRRLRG